MITQDEQNYLEKIPADQKITIYPYTQQLELVAAAIINKIKTALPDLEVVHMGASSLKISGQGDLDIYALTDVEQFSRYIDTLTGFFGAPFTNSADSIAWKWTEGQTVIEFYLTDPKSEAMKRQIAVYQMLKNNAQLLTEYEQLKQKMNGSSLKDYQKAKYEFYNRILGGLI